VRQIAIISGKGGTGKTSLTAAFIRLAGRCVAVDADVDAANLALLVPGEDDAWQPFDAGRRAVIDSGRCGGCGACLEACRFEAIQAHEHGFESDPLRCEGCGACAQVCEDGAVSYRPNRAGAWTTRESPWGRLVHAILGVAQDSSGKLVAHLRREARRLAAREAVDIILIDGPPGIGCPVHASITGVDGVIVVTEPTEAGIHDLARALALIHRFGHPAGIILNKADLSPAGVGRVQRVASIYRVPLLGSIPFDPRMPKRLARGETGLELDGVREEILSCWKTAAEVFGGGGHSTPEPLAAVDGLRVDMTQGSI
jgi:MinD superfamily P-loop ATPase